MLIDVGGQFKPLEKGLDQLVVTNYLKRTLPAGVSQRNTIRAARRSRKQALQPQAIGFIFATEAGDTSSRSANSPH
jgi:hypothetical protein